MNKKIILITIIALLVFSAGCKGKFGFKSGKLFKRPTSEPLTPDYHSGYGAIEMKFMQNAPPSEIYEGSDIPIRLELRNKGAATIEEGDLFVFNYNKLEELEIEDAAQLQFSLEGRSADNPDGGYDVIEFNANNKKAPSLKKVTFSVDACYPYFTDAVVPVCINPYTNEIADLGKRGCKVQSASTSGQGGPLAVTKVEPKIIPKSGDKFEMMFKIYLENKGNGKIRDIFEWCGPKQIVVMEIGISDLNTVDGTLDCKGLTNIDNIATDSESRVNLRGNHFYVMKNKEDNIVYCKAEFDRDKGSYITPIMVYASYVYSTSIEETIRIRKYEE